MNTKEIEDSIAELDFLIEKTNTKIDVAHNQEKTLQNKKKSLDKLEKRITYRIDKLYEE